MNRIEQEIRADGNYTAVPSGVAIEKTTFWYDFSVAEMDGVKGVRETYKRAFDEWKKDIRYMTALCIVLNHKTWERYEKYGEYDNLARTYNELWSKCDEYILDDNFTDEEISYFLSATD